ncbi:MAG: hypothetical protein O9256_00320 [Rhizobiaceae bacterium]|nr:hypothetical protein [Rhizobiaceae bacterium]
MMYRSSDKSKAAQKYRLHQMAANTVISGRDMSREDIEMLERWIDEEVPQEERVRRLVIMSIGGETTEQKVKNIARYYNVTPSDEHAERLADALNRIEGIEGDDTLRLIADLLREGILSVDEANAMTLTHVREI